MASIEYSELSAEAQVREGKSGSSYDASSDVTNTTATCFVGLHTRKIRLTAARVVCTKAWAVGTSVLIQLGTKNSVGGLGSVTVLLAQMAAVGDSVAITLASTPEVDANTAILMNSTKSGSMTGNYEIIYTFEYI